MVIINKNKKEKEKEKGMFDDVNLWPIKLKRDKVSPAIYTYKCYFCKTAVAITEQEICRREKKHTIVCRNNNCREIFEVEYV